jgi:poly-gamma-glutamate capsule biosynthesis protein CapA/YwtB (metallophosphatase superfamily)
MIAWWLGLAMAGPYEDGLAALKAGRVDEARALLATAAQAEPTRVEPLWELGWAHWVADDFGATVEAWGGVKALDPSHPDVDFWLNAATVRAQLATVEAEAPPVAESPDEGAPLRVVAAGDTMMGSDLRRGSAGLPPDEGRQLFADVAPVLSAGDLTFLNLEGPLADDLASSKCGPGSSSCYAFRTPTAFAARLAEAGVDVVSLANNHAFDLGPAGQNSTMAALDAVGVAHAGRYGDVASVTAGGRSVAVVAAHSGACCLNVNRIEEVAAAIRLADRTHDLVVLSFHGGAEGSKARHVPGRTEVAWGEQRGDVKALARAAVDAGADLVIGHGPHVLRAMEVYRGRLIAYSLGNFTGYAQFGTGGGATGHTVILDATLAPNGALVSAQLHPVRLDERSVPRIDAAGVGWQHIRELSAADFPDTGVKVDEAGVLSW